MPIEQDRVLVLPVGVPLGPGEAVKAHPPVGIGKAHLKIARWGGPWLFPQGRQDFRHASSAEFITTNERRQPNRACCWSLRRGRIPPARSRSGGTLM